MDEEIDEKELEAHYNYMAKIQEVHTADSCTDSEQLEQVQNDTGYNVFANELQHSEQSESISNTCLAETNDSNVIPDSPDTSNTTLAQELKECKTILAKTSKTPEESNSVRDSCLVALQNKQTEFEKYKAFNDHTIDYDKLERQLNETLEQLTQKDIEIKEGLKLKAYEISVVKEKLDELVKHSLLTKSHYEGLVKQKIKVKNDIVCNEQASNVFRKEHEQYLEIQDLKAQLQDKNIAISELKKLIEKCKGNFMETKFDKPSVVRQPNAQRIPKPSVLGVNHKTNVSRPQHRSNQIKDKVVPNNGRVKLEKTQVEDQPRIPSISNKIKSVTACNDSLNSITSNINAVCATCGKCLVDSDHFPCVTKMLNDVNDRTKKPNVVPISTRKSKGHANKSVATPHKKKLHRNPPLRNQRVTIGYLQGNDLLTGNRGYDLYTISLQELISSTPLCLMAKASPSQAWLWHRRLSHLNFDYINLLSKKDVMIGLPKLKYVKDQLCSSCEVSKAKRSPFKLKAVTSTKGRLNLLHMDLCGQMRVASINEKKYILASDYDNSDPVPQLQNVSSSADEHVPSQQELDLLFGPLYDEFFTACTLSVNKSSFPTNNSNQQDTQPTMNIQPTSEPFTPTYVHAEETKDNQAEEEHL
nr:retrovirus-related Pol polyprotein from transposon TNT 1-94 [Tanacetum cinerariifolium]